MKGGVDLMDKRYRHEWKYVISYSDMLAIRQRMSAIAQPDPHATDGKYLIRSLYFDNESDKALKEKVNGVNSREKFRIRYYNLDTSLIHLEKKCKQNGLGTKYSAPLTATEAQAIVDGDTDWMMRSEHSLIQELYCKMMIQGLRPKTVVDYTREPFIFPAGNVRVTLDYDLKTGMDCTDFLNPDMVTVKAGDAPLLMEVKWDEYLPDLIKAAVAVKDRRAGAFSKYAQCRVYG